MIIYFTKISVVAVRMQRVRHIYLHIPDQCLFFLLPENIKNQVFSQIFSDIFSDFFRR